MATSGAVQVKLELGHRAQVRKKPTVEGFTHDWMVFVRGPEHSNIQHFVEKVVFHLHESFPRPKRVCKDPPYKVEESGYAGFILPIEVYFRNKMSHCTSQEEPKKVRFDYDLFLHLDGHPPVNHLRCEKLTFNNPTEEFRRKLLKAGGQRDPHKRSLDDSQVMVMQEGSTSLFGQHLKLPTLPSNSLTLTFSDAKKSKAFPGSKDGFKGSDSLLTTTTTTSSSKLHKPSKDYKDKPLKEPKSAFRDCSREPSKASKDPSKKPKENQPLRDNPPIPKMGFKEPKAMSKEHRQDGGYSHGAGNGTGTNKRLSITDSEDHLTKKRKKGFSELTLKPPGGSLLPYPQSHYSEKKLLKDKSQVRPAKVRVDGGEALGERSKAPTLPPFSELRDANDSDMEDNMSTKSDSEQPSPASSSSSSSSGFAASHKRQVAEFVRRKVGAVPATAHTVLGPLRSIIHDLHSDDNEDDSEEDDNDDNDMDSDLERQMHTHMTHRHRRVSLSDGTESENSSAPSPHSRHEPPPLINTSNNQILEVKSPIKQTKQDKNKNIDCDKAYLDELVELHRRLMTLRERHILQQIVNLIEETGHFHITNTTFDFDLCSLDKTTVRKLQSYLETSGTS
ncbi:protein AF-9 isoform X1 [Oncorhynchus tshawytscha]|uniref:protein AF-9 isoform X1 n=1 Tax=Oncorhynchus tshawytscha TaxID=74940 RepID=UPI000D0A014F|nr:protein AF-9 isoform X1 [Oncorhynchus tshawytscha]